MTDALAKDENTTFQELASYRVGGKPFTVSEYNHPAPSDYQVEMFPEVASFGMLQDWDAIFQFDYGNNGEGRAKDGLDGFFALQGNTNQEAFTPAAALIFRAGLIAPLISKIVCHIPPATSYSTTHDWMSGVWIDANGGKFPDLLANRMETIVDSSVTIPTIMRVTNKTLPASLAQALMTPSGSQYRALGRSAISLTGYVGGQTADLGMASLTFPQFGNNFAALTMTALDGKRLDDSGHILLTIGGHTQNIDMIWNDDRMGLSHNSRARNAWGHAPAQTEGIPATVMLANANVKHVWALDPTGARGKEIPVTASGGKASFTIGPDYRTVWYEIGE
ncbi:MAG: hypothetical protein P4L33_15765 [Capsulimonadaceae bacterium]|nr:hypothetical protein [Capsulimonadaceae bacterium]